MAVQALSKMGHRWMPKGRSTVGRGSCSKKVAGADMTGNGSLNGLGETVLKQRDRC